MKLKKLAASIATGFMLLTPALSFAETASASTNDETNAPGAQAEGEIILKYSAPAMDWENATEEEEKLLKKQGWELEDGVMVLYRSVPEEIERYNIETEPSHKHANASDHKHKKKHTNTLVVNGKEKVVKGGRFDVQGNPETIKVTTKDKTQVVKQDKDGSYRVVVERNISKAMDMMDEKEKNMVGTLGYYDSHSYGDWVHCNRFNGTYTDSVHYPKWRPRAYTNFIGSDCDLGALRFCLDHNTCNVSEMPAYCSAAQQHYVRYHEH